MFCVYGQTNGNTVTYFKEPYILNNAKCGVFEMTGVIKVLNEHNKDSLFLCCDFCEESSVSIIPEDKKEFFSTCIKIPILRSIERNDKGNILKSIKQVIWVNVNQKYICSIRLYITNRKGECVSFEKCSLKCTLVFKETENECQCLDSAF